MPINRFLVFVLICGVIVKKNKILYSLGLQDLLRESKDEQLPILQKYYTQQQLRTKPIPIIPTIHADKQ